MPAGPRGAKEIVVADYDGAGPRPLGRNGSINLTPVWSPDARSLAYVSYRNGYPDMFRAFPFERRPEQTLSAFTGINSSPAWSPDGRMLALTLSKDGNPEIYLLTLATGAFRRLTRHTGIDTDPSWSPSGREIAFVSDRAGRPHIYVMDAEGVNVRQLTTGGHHTQPRWSPKGDTIVFTTRATTHDLWAISPDGANPRRLTDRARRQPGHGVGAQWPSPPVPVESSGTVAGLLDARRWIGADSGHARRPRRVQVHRGLHGCRDRMTSLRAWHSMQKEGSW